MDTELRFGYIGVGQGGGNIANSFAKLKYKAIAINTSTTDLFKLDAIPLTNKCLINLGLQGAGKNPEIGKQALSEHIEDVINLIRLVFPLDEIDVLFLCAGLGGGTGSGSISLLSQILTELGYKVSLIVTLPSNSESSKTKLVSINAFDEISQIEGIGSCFVIDNAKASEILKDVGMNSKYSKINEYIANKIYDVHTLTSTPSEIAFDMRDFETLLSSRGSAIITTVTISDISEITQSENLAQYVEKALKYSIFAEVSYDQVKGCAFLFEMPEGGSKILTEETINKMQQIVGNPFEVFYGVFETKEKEKEIKLTIVLTGLLFPTNRLEELQEEISNKSEKITQILDTTQNQKFNSNSKDLLNKFITNKSNSSTNSNKTSNTSSTLSKLLENKK